MEEDPNTDVGIKLRINWKPCKEKSVEASPQIVYLETKSKHQQAVVIQKHLKGFVQRTKYRKLLSLKKLIKLTNLKLKAPALSAIKAQKATQEFSLSSPRLSLDSEVPDSSAYLEIFKPPKPIDLERTMPKEELQKYSYSELLKKAQFLYKKQHELASQLAEELQSRELHQNAVNHSNKQIRLLVQSLTSQPKKPSFLQRIKSKFN